MSKRGAFRTNFEYAAARALLSGLGLVPRPLAVKIGRALGRTFYYSSRKLRKTGERNLELAFPEMSKDERDRILLGCFMNLGRQLGEVCHFSKMTPEDLLRIFETEGLANLEEALAKGRGVILFTGHLGAWELSSLGLSVLGHPLSFLVRRIDNPKIEKWVERTRSRFGNKTIEKRGASRSVIKILRQGGALGLLTDINMVSNEGIFVDFFGIPASTTTIVAKLALHTDAPVIPVFAPWDEKKQRFILELGAPLSIERTGNNEEDIRRFTALSTKVMEDYIRRYPEQWLWIHKRWRTRPG